MALTGFLLEVVHVHHWECFPHPLFCSWEFNFSPTICHQNKAVLNYLTIYSQMLWSTIITVTVIYTGFARSLESLENRFFDFRLKKVWKTVIFSFSISKSGKSLESKFMHFEIEIKVWKIKLPKIIYLIRSIMRNFNSPDESRTENMIIVYSIASFLVRDHMTSHVS